MASGGNNRSIVYKVGFDVDVASLRSSVEQATKSLESIQTTGTNSKKLPFNRELQEANQSAQELKRHLQEAFNTQTGHLDLGVLQSQMEQSGMSLEKYAIQLKKLGPEGEKAFMHVASAITQADLPLRRTTVLLDKMWTTLSNTLRWQISSRVLYGFFGAISTAYGYTQDLNESLNSIRMITQQSTEEMGRFAEQANKAAKTLSTTTVEYTNAALIYYRQGLTGDDVLQRADVTTKLANVSGETAEQASEQMTAVWNNFYDGSKSLEYYADVMAKLGATTASSVTEISTGLQKFAAVAGTVGLSYEYAASALATITATTRQSADVVGTALRTLFGRIESLKLGETLEDGVDLNKYSKALKTAGVEILDMNGNLKDMDVILTETMDKWETLTRAQQMALAQTVAGVRQYTQFVALMDQSDFFKQNLQTAYGAEGTLGQQQAIYAESWEAARDRVKAAAEDISDSLINEDFFIGLDKTVTPLLTVIAKVIDGFGGMGGAVSILSGLMLRAFSGKIVTGLMTMREIMFSFTGKTAEAAAGMKTLAAELVRTTALSATTETAEGREVAMMQQKLTLQELINGAIDKIPASQQQILQNEQQNIKNLQQQAELYSEIEAKAGTMAEEAKGSISSTILSADWKTKAKEAKGKLSSDVFSQLGSNGGLQSQEQFKKNLVSITEEAIRQKVALQEINEAYSAGSINKDEVIRLANAHHLAGKETTLDAEHVDEFIGSLDKQTIAAGNTINALKQLGQSVGIDSAVFNNLISGTQGSTSALNAFKQMLNLSNEQLYKLAVKAGTLSDEQLQQLGEKLGFDEKQLEKLNNQVERGSMGALTWADSIVTCAQGLAGLGMAFSSTRSFAKTFFDESESAGDKLSNLGGQFFSLTFSVSMLAQSFKTLGIAASTSWAVGVIIGLTALNFIIEAVNKNAEKNHEINQKIIEDAGALREENQKSQELISNMKDLLDAYRETGEGKADLDNATRELAEAYNVEGSALAELSGKYEDYNNVLKKSIEKRNQALRQELKDQNNALTAAENELFEIAKKQQKEGVFVGKNRNATESKATEILNSVEGASRLFESSKGFGPSWVTFQYDESDPKEISKAYDIAYETLTKLNSELSIEQRKQSDIYKFVEARVNELKDEVEQYREIQDAVTELKIQLGDGFVSDANISSLEQYQDWIKKIQKTLSEQGYDESRIESVINTLASTSINPKIKEFKQLNDAIDDSWKLVVKDSNMTKEQFTEFWKTVDKTTASQISWGTTTTSTLREAYERAMAYAEAEGKIADGQAKIEAGQKALEDLDSGEFTAESLEALQAFDWESQGISFQEFLNSTFEEQQRMFNQMIGQGYESQVQAYEELREKAIAELAEVQQQIEELEGSARLKEAENQVKIYSEAKKAYEDYKTAIDEGNSESAENALNIFKDAFSSIFGGDEFVGNLSYVGEETLEKMAKAIEGAQGTIDLSKALTVRSDELNKKIQNAINSKELTAVLNIQFQIERMENVTDKYVNFFKAIKDGAQQATNEAGESVWHFSRESINAISAIYPEFKKNAEVLRDGTFQVSEEMYQATLGRVQKELFVDKQGLVKRLQALIEYDKAMIAEDQTKLELAEKIASGEVKLEELSTETKKGFLEDLQSDSSDIRKEMLDDEATYLETNEDNWADLFDDVQIWAAEAGNDVSDSIDTMTGNVVDDLKSIRDGAYAAMRQIQEMARAADSEGKEGREISFKVVRKGTNHITPEMRRDSAANTLQHDLDRSRSQGHGARFEFDDQMTTSTGTITSEYQKKVGEALKEIYQSRVAQREAAMSAKQDALSKLFESMNDTIGGLGGKSGKSGSSGKDNIKETEKVLERYHEITREIEYQKKVISDLDKQIERTYGVKRLDLYGKKMEELTKLADLQRQKALAGTAFLASDLKDIQDSGLMPKTNDHDEITNFTDLLDQTYKEFKQVEDAFNQGKVSEKEYEEAQKLMERREKYLENYENSLDTQRQFIEEAEDTIRQIEDLKLDKLNYQFEIVLDVKEVNDKVRDISKTIAESYGDALTQTVSAFGLKQKTNPGIRGVAETNREQVLQEIGLLEDFQQRYLSLTERLKEANEYTNTTAIKEQMADLIDKISSSVSAIIEWTNYWENMVPNAINAASERLKKFTDQLSKNTSVLDTVKELMILQGQLNKTEEGFIRLQRISQERLEAQRQSAMVSYNWYQTMKDGLEDAKRAFEEFNGDEQSSEYDYLRNNYEAYLAQFNEAQQAYLDSAKAAMETAKQMYLDQISHAAYDFGEALKTDLDYLSSRYDHYIDQEERYLDAVNTAYQTTTWYNKLQADIDKALTSSQKERYKALQDEVGVRAENNKLNQYDLDIIEAKYKVLQAQAALEDAQAAKNNLRLVRDRQGNWNYQFTANPDEVAKAQQDLDDARNDWYNIAKKQTKDVTGQIIATWEECQQAIEELYQNMELTDEERSARAIEIYDYYRQAITDLEREKQIAIADMTEAGELTIQNFENTYAEALSGMSTSQEDFEQALKDYMAECEDHYRDFKDTVHEVGIDTGTDLTELDSKINEVAASTRDVGNAAIEAESKISGTLHTIQEMADYYRNVANEIDETIRKMRELALLTGQTVTQSSGLTDDQEIDYSKKMVEAAKNQYWEIVNSLATERQSKLDAGGYDDVLDNDSLIRLLEAAYKYGDKDALQILEEIMAGKRFFTKDLAGRFATGGYTGEWGNSSKLAWLDQKELVLNANDTSNILAAVEVIRAIAHDLDANATMTSGFLAQRLGGIIPAAANPGALEQDVHIEAVFPNVTESHEIEQALASLVNDAAQWANREKS